MFVKLEDAKNLTNGLSGKKCKMKKKEKFPLSIPPIFPPFYLFNEWPS